MNKNLEDTVHVCFVNFPCIFIICICFSQISWHIFWTVCFICGNRGFVTQCCIRKIIVYKILYNHISNAGAYLWTMKSTFNELFLLICSDSLKGGPVPQNTVCFTAVLHIKDVSSCLELSTLPLMQSDRYACA